MFGNTIQITWEEKLVDSLIHYITIMLEEKLVDPQIYFKVRLIAP